MLTKLLAFLIVLIGVGTLLAAITQSSAYYLRQEQQSLYWPRHDTSLSGRYYNNAWQPDPVRSTYGSFRGGGPGAGK